MFAAVEPLLLVGAGKMGGAMLDGWLDRGLSPGELTVLDPFVGADRRRQLEAAGISVSERSAEISRPAFKTAVIAVKPQVMTEVLDSVRPLVGPQTLIVSVAAGIRLSTLEMAFRPGQPVVRMMPNTPAQIRMGMSVCVHNSFVGGDQRNAADTLARAVGETAWVDDEGLIDAVTAVSGSGPAYVFLLVECLAGAAREAGLPTELADRLARQTVIGSGALLAASSLPAAELRSNVTSPNGTTAAALAVLMGNDGLQPLMTRAVEAARRRSVELG
jgi:pyrroline-5-carboxylate reductase